MRKFNTSKGKRDECLIKLIMNNKLKFVEKLHKKYQTAYATAAIATTTAVVVTNTTATTILKSLYTIKSSSLIIVINHELHVMATNHEPGAMIGYW